MSDLDKPKRRLKATLWQGISAVLAVLLVISIYTSGFGIFGDDITGGAVAQPQAPSRVEVSTDDDAVLGDPNAPVTIIEFSDYQCQFCSRFWEQTLPLIKSNYIETGKVKLIFRDLPLTGLGHAYAQKAGEATECAEEQGMFWEMHDKLFENYGELSSTQKQVDVVIEGREIITLVSGGNTYNLDITDSISMIGGFALDLGLDITEFNSCLDSGKYEDEVNKDYNYGGNAGVSGTPTFFIGNDKEGYIKIVGAQPFEVFKQVIDSELA